MKHKYSISLTVAEVFYDAAGEVVHISRPERLPTRSVFVRSGGEALDRLIDEVESEAGYRDFLLSRDPLYRPGYAGSDARRWQFRVSGVLRESGREIGYHSACGPMYRLDGDDLEVEDVAFAEDKADEEAARASLLDVTAEV
ncbi:hypothetical protein [Acidithiobacillus caldus]|uniref:hypothetical protein n=1 Tax=Acidithiobacillus caldus TaxID=33059 RepID=UPI0007D90E83|nr:hypothetical protein [Acidithiobacillus caldus]QER43210.1 hypothetical protein F0726_00118 [Acidithiobacillus caldus]